MRKLTEHKAISGRIIRISTNYSKRRFTIYTESGKYRTHKMSQQEFDSEKFNTGN